MTTKVKKVQGIFYPLDYPEINQFLDDLIGSLFNESGRGAILIATTHVDDHLTELIETVLPKNLSKNHKEKLFKYPGQLSSFSSKIELAYVFRLIHKNLYDSLNTLRKVRNDAAHSHSKFELHELNEQLKSVYEIGPGFSNFIREESEKLLIQHKTRVVKNALAKVELTEDEKRDFLEKAFADKEKIEIMKKELPFWELVHGLTYLCGLLAYHKHNIGKLTQNITIFSDLSKNDQ